MPHTHPDTWPSFSSETLAVLAKRQAEETYGIPLTIEYVPTARWTVRMQAGLDRKVDAESLRTFLCGVLFGAEAQEALSEETPPTPSVPPLRRALSTF